MQLIKRLSLASRLALLFAVVIWRKTIATRRVAPSDEKAS